MKLRRVMSVAEPVGQFLDALLDLAYLTGQVVVGQVDSGIGALLDFVLSGQDRFGDATSNGRSAAPERVT